MKDDWRFPLQPLQLALQDIDSQPSKRLPCAGQVRINHRFVRDLFPYFDDRRFRAIVGDSNLEAKELSLPREPATLVDPFALVGNAVELDQYPIRRI